MSKRIIILGPAHPLRGGIAAFNERLARAFTEAGHYCTIVSFSFQYPDFLFPGKTQYSTGPAPAGVEIKSLVHSLNPLNWLATARWIRNQQPDLILVRFWLPLMAPALGSILQLVKKGRNLPVVCLADNVVPHEARPGDAAFTRYFMKACDAFVVMSQKVRQDLARFVHDKPVQLVHHPLYDHFGNPISKAEARKFLGLGGDEKVILFFGFIRKYKGLDLLLQAMALPEIRGANVKLLVAGEFYEPEAPYRQIIEENGLTGQVVLRNDFIPDEQVKYFLCAADCVVQPYRSATQSGVTPLAYHFETPMIVTNVGGLPDLVTHGTVGLVCEPQPDSIAQAIVQFYNVGPEFFKPFIQEEKKKYSWARMADTILKLAGN